MKKNIVLLILFIILFIVSTIIDSYSFSNGENNSNTDKLGTIVEESIHNLEEDVKGVQVLNSSLPVLSIKLNDVDLETINNNSKDVKYVGNNLVIIDNGEEIVNEKITIKGRGNTTWKAPKKPYQIKFDKKMDLFNMGASKKWILLANFYDPSLLKTKLAHYIGDIVHAEYNYDGVFINLYVDNEYMGVYYLTHKVEIGESTLDLKNDYGVLMELDNAHYLAEDDEDVFISNNNHVHFIRKDVVNEANKTTAANKFMENYNALEEALNSKNWNKVQSLFDIESLASYYVVQSFMINRDAYNTSFFFYMDGLDDKIHVGPLWDFDLSLSFDSRDINDKHNAGLGKRNPVNDNSPIYRRNIEYFVEPFFEYNKFNELVLKKRKELLLNKQEIIDAIDKDIELIKEDAFINTSLWEYNKSYDELIEEFKHIVETQFIVLERQVNGN